MKLVYMGAIATASVIVIGITLAAGPTYLHAIENKRPTPVMLSFSMPRDRDMSEWCDSLASILEKHQIKATIFVTGKQAEQYSSCIASLSQNNIDVGSQTYNYVNLTSVDDYLKALEEVKKGKLAIDNAGDLDSRLFRAPYGSTDQNIYSLLLKSNIIADFSYEKQYNKYENGQFVRHDLVTCICDNLSANTVIHLLDSGRPVMVEIDNAVPVTEIEAFIAELKYEENIQFVNASELTGQALTLRRASA